ncbi:MAG TPA: hypothetical protein PKZ76_03380 [Xanthomonadaceae bacterium]|nr:hypothetical protein [Xanthomonadaceae bacterium]
MWHTLAAVISALCAVVAAIVSVLIYRRARGNDLVERITGGDREVREHVDVSVASVRTHSLGAVDEVRAAVHAIQAQVTSMSNSITSMQTESHHMLRARDLGKVHEKINAVAADVHKSSAELGGLREQLNVMYKLMLEERKR